MASITVTYSGLAKGLQDIGLVKDSAKNVAININGLTWGLIQGAACNSNPTATVTYSASDAVFASGTLTLSTASGAVGGTIDGTACTATAAGGDTNSAALVAAAINANATANKKVRATSSGAVVTVSALIPGVVGNKLTLVASGTGVTASGGTLTGGVGADTFLVTGQVG